MGVRVPPSAPPSFPAPATITAGGKDLLLINPWIHDFTAYDFWMKPLGLLYAASLVRRHTRHRVSFIDCLDRCHPSFKRRAAKPDGRGPFPKEEIPKPAAVRDVPRRFSRYGIPVPAFDEELARVPRPDAVLVTSVMTYWYPGVILGGIYASLCPEHARAESGADLVAPGPAEDGLWPALSEALGGAVPSGPDLSGPDPLPTPAFDLLRDKSWLPVLTSRGCPMRCTFCASSLLSPGFTQRPAASVLAEVAGSHARFGTKHFAFYDDALLARKTGHAWPLFEGLAAGPPLSFHTPNGLHVREIDGPTARLMRTAGLDSLYLSLESADPRLLEDRCPKAGPRDLETALGALEAAGYDRQAVGVYLIVGLPGQPAAGIAESIAFVRSLGAVPRVAYYSPIPGTPEWAGLVRAGVLDDRADPLLHNKTAFAYLKSGLPPSEVESLLGSPARDAV
jgi:hypothetical protein